MLANKRKKRGITNNSVLLVVLAPVHFAYLAIIVLAFIPEQITSATCTEDQLQPYIMQAGGALFLISYLMCLSLHCCGYCIKWESAEAPDEAPEDQKLQRM